MRASQGEEGVRLRAEGGQGRQPPHGNAPQRQVSIPTGMHLDIISYMILHIYPLKHDILILTFFFKP